MLRRLPGRISLCLLALCCSPLAALAQYTAPAKPHTPPASPTAPCPWLTQGTAAKILGGDAAVTANVSGSGEGLCLFTRQQESPGTLEITVSKAPSALSATLPVCPANSVALRAIGNEAVMCRHSGAHKELIQIVVGRVRDQNFTVTLTSQQKNLPLADPQDEPVARVAELVAGNLF